MCVYDLPGSPCEVVDPPPFWEGCIVPDAVICDNFDGYATGSGIHDNADHWGPWPPAATPSLVSDEQEFSSPNSLKIGPGGVEDNLLLLGDQTEGTWSVRMMMYVPSGANGYYNMQNTEATGVWNFDLFLNQGGMGDYQENQVSISTFTFPEDTWFKMEHIIDLDNSLITVELNGDVIHTGAYLGDMVGAINFFSIDATNTFYIDDLIVDDELISSVYEYENIAFRIYPNPTEGLMTITSDKEIESAVVRNVLGEAVISPPVGINTGLTMDMSSLKAGIYFVTLQVEGKLYTERVVKQ
jgi:hypothetical protein